MICGGEVFKESSRGQQGCPAMMPIFCAMKKEMRDRVDGVGDLDYAADYADDGVDGGDYEAVLKILENEIRVIGEYGLRNNYTKMKVYPLAGHNFLGDLSGFIRLGIEVDDSCDVKFMKTPIVGGAEFFREWADERLELITM